MKDGGRHFACIRAAGPKLKRLCASIVLCILAAACGRDSGISPELQKSTRISIRTIVIDTAAGISLFDVLDSIYVFQVRENAPQIPRKSIIVSSENGGYIRRVVSVDTVAGRLHLTTEPASLANAVILGGSDTKLRLGLASVGAGGAHPGGASKKTVLASPAVTASGGGLALTDFTLYSGEAGGAEAEVTVKKGYIEFNPEAEIGFEIRHWDVQSFHAEARGRLIFDFDLLVDATGEVDLSHEEILASVSQTVVEYIGPVPVVEVFTLDYMLGFVLSAGFSGGCAAGSNGDMALSISTFSENGSWSDVATVDVSFDAHPFGCAAYSEAGFRVYIRPSLHISIYKLPVTRLEFEPYAGFTAVTDTLPPWHWELFGGIRGRTETNPEILGDDLSAHAAEPIEWQTTLATGPFETDEYFQILAWGSEGSGDGQFVYPRGIALDGSGDIYVVDNQLHRVQKFAPDTTLLANWGSEGSGDGEFSFPKKAAVDGEGNLYVVDGRNRRVQKFSADGTFISKWGSEGTGDGQFMGPEGIAVDGGGNVYVVDGQLHRVQKFTAEGVFLTQWGSFGNGDGQFNGPAGIAAGPDGVLYVTECYNQRIQKFTSNGEYVCKWGSGGTGGGEFDCPLGVAVDGEGNVYVADYGNDRFQRFTSGGEFTAELGSPGSGDGQFDRPEGVAVDRDGNVYVLDSGNRRILKFLLKPR